MSSSKRRSECPVSSSLEEWGDKWSLLIIRDLIFHRKLTYGDFLKSPEKIATNILAARLQMLEENDLIAKSEHPDSKAKVLYRLTQKGIDLVPVIVEINLWAEKYFKLSDERKEVLKIIKKDKPKFIKERIRELSNAKD